MSNDKLAQVQRTKHARVMAMAGPRAAEFEKVYGTGSWIDPDFRDERMTWVSAWRAALAAHEAEKPSSWIPGWTFDTEALVAKLAKLGVTVPPNDRRDDGVVLYDARKADYLFMSSYGDWREAEKQAPLWTT